MIRLTEPQRIKYLELGGARWVKRLLNEEIERKTVGASIATDNAN
jgi:hypothetical protein